MKAITKLSAFQLKSEGSLFSVYKSNKYTLIEARIPKGGINVLAHDLQLHGKSQVDLLHITSWDTDHCNYADLVQIINNFRPAVIQVPSYLPDTEDGILCRNVIIHYDQIHQRYVNNVEVITEQFINSLPVATAQSTNDILYHSMYNVGCKNDMSLIRLFRSAGFNVLSLGDCDSPLISARLRQDQILQNEVDVLILPHHGADTGFLDDKFLQALNPRIAVCCSDYDNRFDHPTPAVCQLLERLGIPLVTKKRGDVVILQSENESTAYVINYIADNDKSDGITAFQPKRAAGNKRVA